MNIEIDLIELLKQKKIKSLQLIKNKKGEYKVVINEDYVSMVDYDKYRGKVYLKGDDYDMC